MDDLIFRQAAIEEINRFLGYLDEDMLFRLSTALKRLPAAQRWIPVTERMPEAFQKVLIFWWEHSEPMMDTAFWQKDAKRFVGNHWIRMEDKTTHWMPLPEPPKD